MTIPSVFKQHKTILLCIIGLAVILRFWQISSLPPSMYWDEVSQGYNSYAILTTGKDEHQEMLPLARFIAFGDYKAPVNIYLTVPVMAVFGKTEFSVRFVSAFLGVMTVLAAYFVSREFFMKQQMRDQIALLVAFFLAISPWHIQLSRVAYEGNVATFFTVLGVLCFFIALRKKSWWFLLSGISFVLAFYSFNSQRVFVPLLVVFLTLIYHKELWQLKKNVIISGAVCLLLLLPIIQFLMMPESKLRFAEVNIFSDVGVVEKSNALIAQENNSLLSKILYNRRVLYAQEYITNYFDFFNPKYLFVSGDVNPRFSHGFNGQLYLWMLPLILAGLYYFCTNRNRVSLVVIGWFLLAPVAAATARETPHALRSETFLPTYEIFAALGCITLFLFLKSKTKYAGVVCISALLLLSSFSVIKFWHNYSTHNKVVNSAEWQYGYKETMQYVNTIQSQYDEIYFQNTYGRPSIYVAWYGNFSLPEYWKQVTMMKEAQGLYTVQQLGKYHFVEVMPILGQGEKKILFISNPGSIPQHARVLKRVPFLNGKDAFVISEI